MVCEHFCFHFGLLWLLNVASLANTQAQPVVQVEQGMLLGKTVLFSEQEYINIDRELDVYEGVPFAEPPIRFEYPVKKAAWNGTYNATYVRPSCYQVSPYVEGLEVSEDCLYMNIYVPRGVSSKILN